MGNKMGNKRIPEKRERGASSSDHAAKHQKHDTEEDAQEGGAALMMLTNDLLDAIFRILSAADLCSLCETNKEWHTAAQDARRRALLRMTGELVARNDHSPQRIARMQRLVAARPDLALPDGLTFIGDWAFRGRSSLATIELPAGLTSIGFCAFQGCSSLATIKLPTGLTSVDDCSFKGCSSLATIELPDGLTSIGDGAFRCCSSLVTIELPAGLTSIGHRAFDGCSSLVTIELPAGLTSFVRSLFRVRILFLLLPLLILYSAQACICECTEHHFKEALPNRDRWNFFSCVQYKKCGSFRSFVCLQCLLLELVGTAARQLIHILQTQFFHSFVVKFLI